MTERWALALSAGAALGALRPSGSAWLVGLVAFGAAACWRHPALLCVAAALFAATGAHRALAGLEGVEERDVAAEVTLLSDPRPSFGGMRVDVRLDGRRLEGRAAGVVAAELEPRLAGEIVKVRGSVSPTGTAVPWLVSRHVGGRLTILAVEGWRSGDATTRLANGLRRTLVAGSMPLTARQRSLYTGLVIGDDRGQPADLGDEFLGAGLTHLLAVSGQNVAFTLALFGPLLRRLRLWPRLVVTLAVIGLFGVMTRFEPSVLRASAMAALAATLAMGGRPVSRLRIIAFALTALILVDPLLVRSVGFQLSVAAALAIVMLAPRITPRLPGPAPLREALGVTVAAQLGVAPVLLHTFGPIPVASFPANLLAVPVAGLVMVWGLTGGLIAGVVGEPLAAVLHLPTRLALGWLEVVADRSAAAALGELHMAHVVALALGLALAVVAHGKNPPGHGRGDALAARGPRWADVGRAGSVLAVSALVAATLSAHAPAPLRTSLTMGVVRWHAGSTDVVVLGGVGGRTRLGERSVLEALRRDGVGSIDLLVVADDSVPESIVREVIGSHDTAAVVAQGAALLDIGDPAVARLPPDGVTVDLGALRVRVVVVPDRLVVDASRVPP